MPKHFISAIVPAYNEEKTIATVLKVILNSPQVDEVICINDGSTDNTLEAIKEFNGRVQIVDIPLNKGKGNAMAEGIKIAKGDILLFLDGDLLTLQENHIFMLLDPLLKGKKRATIGNMLNKAGFSIFSDISGQRSYFKSDLIPYIDEISKTRYGVEVFLNHLIPKEQTSKVNLINLNTLFKHQKYDPVSALDGYKKEILEIAKVLYRNNKITGDGLSKLIEIQKVTNTKVVLQKLEEITDVEIREFLEKYILRHLRNL